ncbi:MAG TPA: DEAD/DEAH box helicase, partial [Propionibacteriaceae bacterium]
MPDRHDLLAALGVRAEAAVCVAGPAAPVTLPQVVTDWTQAPQVRYVHRTPARPGSTCAWPQWLPSVVSESCRRLGIAAPWAHQVQAAEAARAGRHVVMSTGTASGKTLGYLLPVLAATYGGSASSAGPVQSPVQSLEATRRRELLSPRRPHTALYLAPTKALAHDQLRTCLELELDTLNVATLDGDTERADRDWARDHATYILTNPDMLHCSVLPQHQRWAQFLSSLRYVVVDESHRYRGVFGAHVSAVLRRLRRIAALYGADPTFVLASATSSNPGWSASALIGVAESEVVVVDQDSSAQGKVEMVLWEPDGSADEDAARLLAELVDQGRQTIAFVQSRQLAERVAAHAARLVTSGGPVEAYRGGYLASDRRRLERALQDGALVGVAATNALELGVDIAGMDAVVIAGFPGTRAALWQQAGRAGRKGKSARVIVISRQQPLDAYFFDHPQLLFSAPVEATVLHPDNPYVLGPHLAAAAQESPLTADDRVWFGDTLLQLAERLASQGVLRRRSGGWFWTRPGRAV